MRTYYLFKLKRFDDLKQIYLALEDLYYLNSNKFEFGKTIFNEICMPLNKDYLLKELKRDYLFLENRLINSFEGLNIKITNICIIVKTNENFPTILKRINKLEKGMLVVDFENKDYFILDDFIKLNFKIAI